MGFLEKIFGRRGSENDTKASEMYTMLDGYQPIFTSWSGSVYESDLIRSAIDAHGRHSAKLRPTFTGNDAIARRLELRPNSWQTWPKFLYQLATILYAMNTAFIVPTLGKSGEVTGICAIAPQRWEVVQNDGVVFVRFYFADGKRRAIELSKIGIMTRFQYRNELFGETNDAMQSTLDLIKIQQDGITEGVKSSCSYQFIATSSNWSTDKDLAKESERFSRENFVKGRNGVLVFPNTYKDVKQVQNTVYTVDEKQMNLIKQNVYGYLAINDDIIQNKAYGDGWLAFYEGAIEWFAVCASDAITQMLYSDREQKFGSGFFLTSNRLQYMSNTDKLSAISQLADRGLMTRNELRDILNLPPLPLPYGNQIPARGEYYNINEMTEQEDDEDAGEE